VDQHSSPKRDRPGPDHIPNTGFLSGIDGVVLQSSPFVRYGVDNALTELYRPEWPGVCNPGEPVEHLYTVFAPSGGTRAEWYFHEHTLDRYMLLQGTLSVGLYDGRAQSQTFGHFEIQTLEAHNQSRPNGVRIPPGVWHSLKWESKQGLLLNAKLPGFVRENPDKFRIQLKDLPPEIAWKIDEV
jgi:dTDP-4-dehydrorhamnose 3,5-epimerase-like enzyme